MGKPEKAAVRELAKGPDLALVNKPREEAKPAETEQQKKARMAVKAYRRLHPSRIWPD
ncbi:MAG: hypothetical protein JOZ42_10700 [Acetobacteraceae bacterium]|nr:hypothetical protein [Acetobacteraceae bacterium]